MSKENRSSRFLWIQERKGTGILYYIGGNTYSLIKDHKNGWNQEVFRERYSSVLDRYDFIVGDWGYNQLRLKGFFKEPNKGAKDASISLLHDYLNEYCNFGCAYFIIEKQPSRKGQLNREPDEAPEAEYHSEASKDPDFKPRQHYHRNQEHSGRHRSNQEIAHVTAQESGYKNQENDSAQKDHAGRGQDNHSKSRDYSNRNHSSKHKDKENRGKTNSHNQHEKSKNSPPKGKSNERSRHKERRT